MKLAAILNQAKATAEGISFGDSWSDLTPQISAAPEELRLLLFQDYEDADSLILYHHVLQNLRLQRAMKLSASSDPGLNYAAEHPSNPKECSLQ